MATGCSVLWTNRCLDSLMHFGKNFNEPRETAFQIALRNCSKEVEGKVSIHVILVKGECMQSSTYFLQKVSASHEAQTSP